MSVASLKKDLKALGLPMTGEKPALENRLKLHALGEKHKVDGTNPLLLKAGPLKKALATRGLPCDLSIEDKDALVGRLLEALKSEGGSAADDSGGDAMSGGSGASDDGIALAVAVAKQALELGEAGDYEAVLGLAGAPISKETGFAALRRAYLNLSRLVHPDKLSRHCDFATRAFQEVVRAFDTLSNPESAKESAGRSTAPTIARSNQNCFRTRLFCPRCGDEWGRPDSGVEKYEYSLLMQARRLHAARVSTRRLPRRSSSLGPHT